MATQDVALRKRQQIAKANRMMFLWVAGASVVVGIALVVSAFLFQKLMFNEKVLGEKSKTASILVQNNKVVDDLKNQVRVLNTSQALKDAMLPTENEPVQVVLDALPSDANSSALGASLQEKFLKGSGLELQSLNVDPVEGVELLGDDAVQDASEPTGDNMINFRFAVSTAANNGNALKELLQRLERSIRPISLSTVQIETQGERLVLEVAGSSYYEPAKTVELKSKTVKP